MLTEKAVSELLRGIVRRQDTAISETIPLEVVKADTGQDLIPPVFFLGPPGSEWHG